MATMTPEEQVALVRQIQDAVKHGAYGGGNADVRALLDMLVEREARGDRAEFYRDHHTDQTYCHECQQAAYNPFRYDPRHAWTDDQWRESARMRLLGEEK